MSLRSVPLEPVAPPGLLELEPAPAAPRARGRLGNGLYRNRWLVGAVVGGFVLLALGLSRWIRPYYKASGSIIIQHASLHNAELTPQEFPPPVDADRELQTELTVLGSRAVVEPVVARLHLETADPEIRAALAGLDRGRARRRQGQAAAPRTQVAYGEFSAKLQLLPDKLSDTVQVVYGSHDARLAAAVVNALTAEFLRQTLAQRGRNGAQTSLWMRRQLEAARQQLEREDAAVAAFQRAHGYVPLGTGADNGLLTRLADADHALGAAQSERLGDEAALRSYGGEVVAALPAELRNPAIDHAADNVGAAAQQLAALEATYQANFPLVAEARAQLAGAQRNLAGLREQVRQALVQRLAASRQREAEQARQVARLEREAAAASGVYLQFGVLQARAEAQRTLIANLEPKLAEIEMEATLPPNNIRVLDAALPPLAPAYPRLGLDLALGLGVGLVAGLGAALVRERWTEAAMESEEITRRLGPALAPLGMIAESRPPRRPQLALPPTAGAGGDGGGYAKAAANLIARLGPPPRAVLVTSPNPGEGKTTACCRLALALAAGGWRTLIVDGDRARPACHRFFGLGNASGLAAAQAGHKVTPDPVAPHLDLLPGESGTGPLQARALAGLLEEWREQYDYILVDSPPGRLSGDAVLLSSLVEGVVVVLRWGHTRLPQAERLCEEMARARAPLTGTLLTRADPQAPAYRPYRAEPRAQEPQPWN